MVRIQWLTNRDEELLRSIFRMILKTGHEASVIPDGFTNEEDFFDGMTSGECWPFAVIESGSVKGFFWLNRFESRFARLHFCTFDKPDTMTRIEFGREVLRQAINMKDDDGYLFDMFMGITPESNQAANAFTVACGAKKVGVLPYGAINPETKKAENGVIVTLTREDVEVR